MPKNPVAVKSIVSTPLADAIAAHYGVEMRSVLTGFKWIGDQIANLEAAGEVDRFIFGFEESYGYLAGPYVRDKDAVIGSMLICEMAAYYRSIGSSIKQRLEEIYKEYGRYLNKVDSFRVPRPDRHGEDGVHHAEAARQPAHRAGRPQGGQGHRLQEARGDRPAGCQRADLHTGERCGLWWSVPPAPSRRSRPTSPPWARIWPRPRPEGCPGCCPLSPSWHKPH